jgi:hypothetical protein
MSFDKALSGDINFKALLGTNIRREHTESVRASTNGGLIVERIYSLSNTANPINAPVEFDGLRQITGVFCRSYFYLERYDNSGRDNSKRCFFHFAQRKQCLLLSFRFYWLCIFKIIANCNWLSYGKLRANYAQVGNDAPIYSVDDVYTIVPPFGSNPQASVTGTKNNLIYCLNVPAAVN